MSHYVKKEGIANYRKIITQLKLNKKRDYDKI